MEHHSDQASPEYGRRRQRWIFVQGLGHIVPRVPADFSALEERARRAMTKREFAYFAGGAGNDTIWGSGGNDTLYGDAGHDQLHGQDGNDVLYGKDGQTDTLDGGSGTDKAQRDDSSSIKDQVLSIESFI